MVAMKQVQSSAVAAHGYDPTTRVLSIQFHGRGTRYDYQDVPPEAAAAFGGAESLGKHHAQHIAGKFFHEAVETA